MNVRLTADERRDEIVAAASIEFAATGYAGTSTDAIARRAGVSQPYLFQLFGTKRDLFLATLHDCFERTARVFEEVGRAARAEGLDSDGILMRMGEAYLPLLLRDRGVLQLQLHAYAASCVDPEIRAAVRKSYLNVWQTAAQASGADAQHMHHWFAEGMFMNVIASIGDETSPEEFDRWLVKAAPLCE
jgi:AcrR family transcriptional regulator